MRRLRVVLVALATQSAFMGPSLGSWPLPCAGRQSLLQGAPTSASPMRAPGTVAAMRTSTEPCVARGDPSGRSWSHT